MKILLVTARQPWPPRRGDQMRAVQTAEFLSHEHQVTVLAPPAAAGAAPPPHLPYTMESYRLDGGAKLLMSFVRALHQGMPLQSSLFFHRDLGRKLRRLAPAADLVIVQLARLAMHVADVGDRPLVVDLIDSLSLNFTMRAAVDRPWLRVPLRAEARLLSQWERRLTELSRRVLVVCDRDRDAIANRMPTPELRRRLRVVPLAVRQRRGDPAAPTSARSPGAAAADPRPTLALTGNLGYFVNADAVGWFLREVWPGVRARRGEVRLLVAGDRPSAEMRRQVAAAGADLVESPADLRSVLAGATVALAPMRCGSGLPIKVLEAWSVGVPVLGTPWAVAGTSGRWNDDFCVAEGAAAWVAAILRLVDDAGERQRLAANGRARLASDYSRRVVRGQWLELVRGVERELQVPGEDAGKPAALSAASA
jgi:glycosyltransferase involved in cell wall biosynthesis